VRLTVIGTGYLGAVHAACMAEMGFEVLGVDVDEEKIATLAGGRAPFHEPGLDELLTRHVGSGRLRFGTSFAEAAEFGDVHFVCVGTPQSRDSLAADLSYVDAAFTELARHLTRPTLVVGKSTVPVGTAERLAELVASTAPAGADAHVAWNPEFLREGFAVGDTLRPDRIVIGVNGDAAADDEELLRDVYAQPIEDGVPFLSVGFSTAELVKTAANAFLATKISFINAMAEICDVTGADVTELSEAIGHDERIGKLFLRAGLGFGGGCLPKDIRAFLSRAEDLGVGESFAFLREVDHVNLARRSRVVELAAELCEGGLDGARVGVLGAAFKPDSDDIRDSPALHVAAAIAELGASVTVYDPAAADNAARSFPQLQYAGSSKDAATGADIVLLLTEWREFRGIDPAALKTVVNRPVLIDARNTLDPEAWREAGWTYRAIGRP
jgi:UDPglucose 6-dehydrogenase